MKFVLGIGLWKQTGVKFRSSTSKSNRDLSWSNSKNIHMLWDTNGKHCLLALCYWKTLKTFRWCLIEYFTTFLFRFLNLPARPSSIRIERLCLHDPSWNKLLNGILSIQLRNIDNYSDDILGMLCDSACRYLIEFLPHFLLTCSSYRLALPRYKLTGYIFMVLTWLISSCLCLKATMLSAIHCSVLTCRRVWRFTEAEGGRLPAKRDSLSTAKFSCSQLRWNFSSFCGYKTAWLPGVHCSICVLWDECGYSLKQMALWTLQHSPDAPRIDYSINIDICSELRDWNLQLDFECIKRKCAHRLFGLVDRHSAYTQVHD